MPEQEVAPQQAQETTQGSQNQAPPADQPAWNGELSALEKEQWYATLDESTRKTVRDGVEARLRNYERGVQSKMQSWSSEKKDLETRIAKAERASKLYETLSQGEDDPRLAEYESAKVALQKQLDELTSDRDSYKTKWEQREEAEAKSTAQKIFDDYPDVMSSDAMSAQFIKLLRAEIEPEQAAAMVRAVQPDPAPKVPKDVALMGRGDSPGSAGESGRVAVDWRTRVDEAATNALRLHSR